MFLTVSYHIFIIIIIYKYRCNILFIHTIWNETKDIFVNQLFVNRIQVKIYYLDLWIVCDNLQHFICNIQVKFLLYVRFAII